MIYIFLSICINILLYPVKLYFFTSNIYCKYENFIAAIIELKKLQLFQISIIIIIATIIVIHFSVATWTETFDSAIYCVQTDHNVTMISGSSHSGCFMIWDKRVQRRPIKVTVHFNLSSMFLLKYIRRLRILVFQACPQI